MRELTNDGLCVVTISHDVEDLLAVCHEVIWLHAAKQTGEPSHTELIAPKSLAERILSTQRNHYA